MAKVLKAEDASGDQIALYDRSTLDEFPDEPRGTVEFTVAPEEDEAEEVDLEALREEVLAEARAEAARKVKEAYEKGLEKGEAAGRQQFEESIAASSEALCAAADAMREAREHFLQSLEPEVVALSKLVAERVLGREIRCDGDLIVETVRRALAKIIDRQRLLVQIHPDDHEALRAHEVTLLEEFDGIDVYRVEPDESIAPGGCIVVSDVSQVDARMDTLLNSVLQALAES